MDDILYTLFQTITMFTMKNSYGTLTLFSEAYLVGLDLYAHSCTKLYVVPKSVGPILLNTPQFANGHWQN